MRLERLYILLICLHFVACIKDDVGSVSVGEPIEVHIRAVHGDVTRTAMGDVGGGAAGSSQSIRWTEDDQIVVWAKEQGASSYTLDGRSFWLRTYNTTYGDADFVTNLPTAMDEDKTYNYYGLYPKPASVSTDSQNPSSKYVSYTIPATQSGKYDPSLDVMVAQGSGRGLAARGEYPNNVGSVPEPSLSFSPLFHLIRIQIPEGANGLGHPVKRLEITFPQNVVGRVSFDATNPTSTMSWGGETNKITVELDDNNLVDAGDGYIWLHVKPTQINGDVTIAAYSSSGVKSKDRTFRMERNMQAKHITPISFSVPRPYRPVVNINLNQIANHLGEDWQKMTLTGLNFVGAAADGSLTITPSNTHIAIYPDVDGDNKAVMSSVNGKVITVTYESEHALLTDKKITLPNNLQPTSEYDSPVNTKDFTVPYLFEEDFSGVSGNNYLGTTGGKTDAIEMDSYGLSRWTGAKWRTNANTSLTIAAYIGSSSSGSASDCGNGRVDTCPLPLKDGSNVAISVTYKISGWTKASNGDTGCNFGITTTSGLINGTTSWKSPGSPDVSKENYTIEDGSENSVVANTVKTVKITGCSSLTRLTWCCNPMNVKTGFLECVTAKFFYIHIDDIKVSIGNEVK